MLPVSVCTGIEAVDDPYARPRRGVAGKRCAEKELAVPLQQPPGIGRTLEAPGYILPGFAVVRPENAYPRHVRHPGADAEREYGPVIDRQGAISVCLRVVSLDLRRRRQQRVRFNGEPSVENIRRMDTRPLPAAVPPDLPAELVRPHIVAPCLRRRRREQVAEARNEIPHLLHKAPHVMPVCAYDEIPVEADDRPRIAVGRITEPVDGEPFEVALPQAYEAFPCVGVRCRSGKDHHGETGQNNTHRFSCHIHTQPPQFHWITNSKTRGSRLVRSAGKGKCRAGLYIVRHCPYGVAVCSTMASEALHGAEDPPDL